MIGTFAVGVVGFVIIPFALRRFQPVTIMQRKLSAVRDLKGTWTGQATFNAGQPGRCTLNEELTLVINDQTENGISGTLTFTDISGTPNSARMRSCSLDTYNAPVNGTVVGTRIENMNGGIMGTYSGSYTQDTIMLNQLATVDNGYGVRNVMSGSASLLRK